MLKVLIPVNRAVGGSGPHRNVVGVLNALSRRKDLQVVLLTGEVDPAEPYAHAANIEIHLGFQPKSPWRILQNLIRVLWLGWRCDLIYVPSNLSSLLLVLPLRLLRPVVAGPNVTPLAFLHGRGNMTRLEIPLICSHWIEASRRMMRHTLSNRVHATRVSVIHHAIDHTKFSPVKKDRSVWRSYGIPEDHLVVIFVGRFNEELKGFRVLCAAWRLLLARTPGLRATLVLVGAGGEAFLASDPTPSCFATGRMSGNALPVLYASADLSVIPSSWENFPFTVLESLASGLPVIATRTGGIPEQLEQAEGGRSAGVLAELVDDETAVYHPDAPERLAGALAGMMGDPAVRREFSARARQRVLDYFTEDRLGAELAALFYRLAPPGKSDQR